MQQMKVSVKMDKINESKRLVKEELIDNPIIIKKIKDLECTEKEFDEYLGYFLAYYEDKICCDKCKNPKKCPKQFDGIAMDLYRSDFGIERKFSLCPSRELERTIALNYLIRDFSNTYLSLTIDDIDTSYSMERSALERAIFETDIEDIQASDGIFVYGPSGSGKSYPLIALCNEFVRENKKCSYVETRNFLESLKNALNNKEEYFSLMSKVKEVEVLVLDNLGDEKISEWTRDDIISGILDYRIKNDLVTYITSSYTLEELVSLYDVSKTNSDVGKIKANKFIERIKTACPRQISIKD